MSGTTSSYLSVSSSKGDRRSKAKRSRCLTSRTSARSLSEGGTALEGASGGSPSAFRFAMMGVSLARGELGGRVRELGGRVREEEEE